MAQLFNTPEPLFTIDEIKEALKKMDLSERGSDEEYGEAVLTEFVQLSKIRRRVEKAWEWKK